MPVKPKRKIFIKWLKIVFAAYLAAGILLYFLQDKLLFHPTPLPPDYRFQFEKPFNEVLLPVNDEKNLSIIRFTVPDSTCRGVVLFFHGNKENVERYSGYSDIFTRNGYEVWMMDYPGFGKSTGKKDEASLYHDAAVFYKLARGRFSPDSIILYGKSLGSGIAAQLATIRDCRRLILESPYYSMDALAAHYAFIYPVSWLLHYHFPTNEFLAEVRSPVALFHGSADKVIPDKQSARLLKLAPPGSERISIEGGGHNDLYSFPLFQKKLDSLLRH